MFTSLSKKTSFLQKDSNAYYNYGLLLNYPCLTISRPPMFPIFTRTILKCFGDMNATTTEHLKSLSSKIDEDKFKHEAGKILLNHTLLRESSILLNITAIVMTFLFTYWFAGKIPALICSLLWAFNYSSIFYSVMYFRVDMMTILNLLTLSLFLILLKTYKHKWKIIIGIILLCSIASLTRLSALTTSFLTVILFNLVKLVYKKWNTKDLWTSLIILSGILSLVSPYLIYNIGRTGTAFPAMNHHAKFWRNQEFAGKPGYPNIAEVARNPYCGPETTTFNYTFKDHSIPEALTQYIKGYWESFTTYLPKMFSFYLNGEKHNFAWLLIFVIVGMIYCVRKKEKGIMIFMFSLIVLFPFAFILPVNAIFSADPSKNVIGVEPRFNMAILPYAFMLCAIGIVQTFNYFSYFFKRVICKQY